MHLTRFSHKLASIICRGTAMLCIPLLLLSQTVSVQAAHVTEAVTSSPLDRNWPTGPSVSSETAILIEAETGTILYEKDAHKKMYPASITKILTTLIATEECELDEQVTFTAETLATIPYDSSRIWVDKDEYMSMEDCLAAILIVSANDVAAGVAEHIAGTLDGFADIMNERAKELGCLNSHFVNAHGYHDPDHYTTAYDMAQIGRAFFENDLLCTFAKERAFQVDPTPGQPDKICEFNKNQLLETRNYEYEYLVGSKTGYTSAAGQTLVSCAQKDGMKLICVVMNAQSPSQYKDTVTLFDFGFSNFTTANIFDNDKTYVTEDSSYGNGVLDVLGDSSPLLNMDRNSIIVLPKEASFSDTTSYVTIATEEENCMATAHYQYGSRNIGNAQIYITDTKDIISENSGTLEQTVPSTPEPEETELPVYVNIKLLLFVVVPCIILFVSFRWGWKFIRTRKMAQNPALTPRRARHHFMGLKNLFIEFARTLQAIGFLISGTIRSVAMRNRYKKRGYDTKRNYKSGRAASRKYYSESADLRTKEVTFHDFKR